MAVLDSCPKHNMVAYLEKSEGISFHEIIDFLKRSSIHHALTVSPVVSTTFVEQFWTSAKSKTINNVRHISAKVAGKSVSISELLRSKQLANVSVPLDHFPVNTLTSKVFSFMVKKGKHFSGKVTPLFATMLVQPTQDEGASSERPSEALPTPSPAPTSEIPLEPQPDSSPAQTSEVPIEHQPTLSPRPSPTTTIPDSIPETSGENLGGHSSSDRSLSGNEGDMTLQSVYDLCLSLCAQVSDKAMEIQVLKAQITKLKNQAKPVIKHHKAYLKSVSLKQRFPRKSFSKKHKVHKESSLDKEGVSTDIEKVSTDRPIVSTDGSKVSTDKQIEGTDEQVEGTEEQNEDTVENFEGTEENIEGTEEKVESTDGHKKGTEEEIAAQATQTSTQTPTSKIFGDDETIAKVLLNMSQAKAVSREKEKGVELKDVEETDRPKPTSTRSLLTLKPLPKIDPKDKGKKKIEEEDESESESDGIPQAEKKFKQLESDEELARKMQEEWEEEEERNRIAEEQAANEALIRNFDDIKARIEADRLLAGSLQEQETREFRIEERASSLMTQQLSQRKFLVNKCSEAIQEQTPTKNQLRNQMMTYLKHVGNFKHAELKIKKFEEVQALYEKIKRSDEDFISIGSAEDERLIKKMNEKGVDSSKDEMIKEQSKEEVQEESKKERSRKRESLDMISSLEDTTVSKSFPPLSTPVTTAGMLPVSPLMLLLLVNKAGRRSSYARVMIELRADVELKDNIVVAMPKITREGHYTCNVRVEYEWKPPRCSSCKVFGHIHEECPKNTGAGEKKTVKKPSQTSRGVPVGPKMGFKPQKEYRPVPKKPNASSSGNKKKGVEPTIEVSNSNPFDVLNSVDNDVEFGTNEGTTNLVNNEATSSGSSFMNIDNDGEFASNTPIGIVESDSEVEVVFDETANLRISTSDNDDYDPYDDDMYENHDLSEHLHSICDDLDIPVHGRKKK
ncbi:hypothetical protein Tco_0750313 [Tanacetum coccineum]|uniref:DUF4283 domain-containing protein n=1 Tax=Tanacetum coccineum TaxID=301880 RepID=A0ABQ4Z415_9ASTR